MTLNDLSKRDLKGFHKELGRRCRIRFVNSGPLAFYAKKTLARAIDPVIEDVIDELKLVRPCCVGKLILLPYAPGASEVSALSQVRTAVHECTHATRLQQYKGNMANWYGEYFTKPSFRALEEGSANEAEAEIVYWLTGILPTLHLENYFLTDESKAMANKSFISLGSMISNLGRGTASHKASREAIKILKSMGVKSK